MKERIVVFWFRRDLRLEDNHGFYEALTSGRKVLPIFVFDRNILDDLRDQHDRRVSFIHRRIRDLRERLIELGSCFFTHYGTPEEAFRELMDVYDLEAVYTNTDYEPYAIERDRAVESLLDGANIAFHSYRDQVIFERDQVLTTTGKPYTVFTPYKRRWLSYLTEEHLLPYPAEEHLDALVRTRPMDLVDLEEMGFKDDGTRFPELEIDSDVLGKYGDQRDYPAVAGTSRLGIHLRFGTLSVRETVRRAREIDATWLSQLIWRDFYMQILYNYPHVVDGPFRKEYAHIPWRNDSDEFARWQTGRTGYPIVDAGMRELEETGYMHNRVRMITASFLCKHLLIDWRWGEKHFAERLLDFDLAANNGNWQWAAGTGCDAAPYFRVFNPWTQAEKLDPEMTYIKRWVPEISSIDYPKPMVDHSFARKRALETYKQGLGEIEKREDEQGDLFS